MAEAKTKFIFKCPLCGEYNVKVETFKAFAGEERWQMLLNELVAGAWAGMIEFNDCCPRCQPAGEGVGQVMALRFKNSD